MKLKLKIGEIEEKIQANDQNEDEHFEVVNTKFEQVDTSDEEDDDGDY